MPQDLPFLGFACSIGLMSGFLIGLIGVGGVILVPLLINVPINGREVAPHDAIMACMFSYMFVSIGGMFGYSRHSSINWKECHQILFSATPAAFMAAACLNLFSESLLKLVLYGLMMCSSVFSLRTLMHAARDHKGHDAVPRSDEEDGERVSFDAHFRSNNSSPLDSPIPLASVGNEDIDILGISEPLSIEGGTKLKNYNLEGELNGDEVGEQRGSGGRARAESSLEDITKYKMWFLGITTGFISPLTGTSGPVVFLPLALTMNYPILNALGAAQCVQLPIAVASSISFSLVGKIDAALGIALAIGATPGVILGSVMAHKINKFHLQVLVTGVLLVASCVLLITFLFE
mmetsp:Transcript_16031/g.30021  ORF Transcript_16031/g.30021 Transcript_16031/m.30021 type:complete len:348 (-) Transcript_16031:14-1057(-)